MILTFRILNEFLINLSLFFIWRVDLGGDWPGHSRKNKYVH